MIKYAPPPPESEEYGMLIPLSCVEEGEERTITAIPEAKEAAEWLASLPAGETMLPEAFTRLDELLRPVAEKLGYMPDEETVRGFGRVFSMERQAQLRETQILQSSARLRLPGKYRYRTETALGNEAKNCVIFATVRGKEVLSFANLNSDDGETVEIGVETAPGERRRGFGKSNVAALCRYFLLKGRRILYEVRDDNPASIALAKAVGFSETAKEYHYVCFLPGKEEE